MDLFQGYKDQGIDMYQQYPKMTMAIACITTLISIYKMYQTRRYHQKLFTSKEQVANKVVLITGCGSGFGKAIALELSIKTGYRVISTCRRQESVDEFLSNSSYTSNGSTAYKLDVTNSEELIKAHEFTVKYLSETDSILWGIINNAGFAIGGYFELIPAEFDELERNVLYNAPRNIVRKFLPLLPGRKNHKTFKPDSSMANGGRIVNMSSIFARYYYPLSRYGPSKAALTYFSHVLRMEIAPRFGIWVSSIEPGSYRTSIWSTAVSWSKRVKEKLEQENKAELMEMYNWSVDKVEEEIDRIEKGEGPLTMQGDIQPVIDSVIHGLSAKYPKRSYQDGWDLASYIMIYGPLWITEPLMLSVMPQ